MPSTGHQLLVLIISSLLLFESSNGQETQVEITDPPGLAANAYLREAFYITCHVEAKPEGKFVEFLQDSDSLAKDQIVVDPDRHIIEKPEVELFRLVIKSVRLCDQASYQCLVRLTNEASKMASVFVRVISPPVIQHYDSSSDLWVDENKDVTLVCRANGVPAPVVRWSRVDQSSIGGMAATVKFNNTRKIIDHEEFCRKQDNPNENNDDSGVGEGTGILTLTGVRPSARGLYKCTAETRFGSDTRIIRLDVRFAPQIEIRERIKYQAVGYQQEIICEVMVNPPGSLKLRDFIWWTRNGRRVEDEPNRYKVTVQENGGHRYTTRLLFLNVQPSDYGTYVCSAKGGPVIREAARDVKLESSAEPQKLLTVNAVRQAAIRTDVPLRLVSLAVGVFLVDRLL